MPGPTRDPPEKGSTVPPRPTEPAASGGAFHAVSPTGPSLPGVAPAGSQSDGVGRLAAGLEQLGEFYYAEGYHQQYLAKNPNGYCGPGGTGVSCPVGVAKA
jgi:hypothetical protein